MEEVSDSTTRTRLNNFSAAFQKFRGVVEKERLCYLNQIKALQHRISTPSKANNDREFQAEQSQETEKLSPSLTTAFVPSKPKNRILGIQEFLSSSAPTNRSLKYNESATTNNPEVCL